MEAAMTARDIQKQIANSAALTVEQLLGGRARSTVALKRAAIIKCRQLGWSAPKIARAFNVHYTTVQYHCGELSSRNPPQERAA
jgi:chromosomal replication initiation ATPase DnaA